MIRTSEKGRAFIRDYEELKLEAYQDQAGIWTIGYGTTRYPNGQPVQRGDTLTEPFALVCFEHDLYNFEMTVNNALRRPADQQEFDALVSLTYNIGSRNFLGSTLLKVVNENPKDYKNVSYQIRRWHYVTVKGKKEVSKGLTARRSGEYRIYKFGDYERK